MPFRIVRNDITKMNTDAIVNTANPEPVIGRGTDMGIYHAAGKKELLEQRQKLGRIERGQAAVTPGFRLPARYIIHTVGPVWQDGNSGEAGILQCCYENSLHLAREYGCESIAFPLISTGVYGFPKELALQIILEVVSRFLMKDDMMIYLVVFDDQSSRLSERLFEQVESYIDEDYIQKKRREEYFQCDFEEYRNICRDTEVEESAWEAPEPLYEWSEEKTLINETSAKVPFNFPLPSFETSALSLKDLLLQKDETFQQMLMRLIAESGMSNAEVYKKANQDKKLFSKIKNDVDYQPKKKTVLAFALALELNADQTKDLLARAGYAFSPSSSFDKAMLYFIEHKEYNIYEIEIILYDLGLETLCNY